MNRLLPSGSIQTGSRILAGWIRIAPEAVVVEVRATVRKGRRGCPSPQEKIPQEQDGIGGVELATSLPPPSRGLPDTTGSALCRWRLILSRTSHRSLIRRLLPAPPGERELDSARCPRRRGGYVWWSAPRERPALFGASWRPPIRDASSSSRPRHFA